MSQPSPVLDATQITRLIVSGFAERFLADTDLEVAIAGAGPSGLTAARLLAAAGRHVAVLAGRLQVGGGVWGGGMLFPRLVIQEEARPLLEEIHVHLEPAEGGYYTADSGETVAKCTAAARDAGASIWVGITVEDVMVNEADEVRGVVVNWDAVEKAGLHVDPLSLGCRVLIDATGHDASVLRTIQRKIPGARLDSPTGQVMGERSMNSALGENQIVELTREVYPNVIASGMAANAVASACRMGPIFGGMFLSGQKAAQLALAKLA